MSYIETTVTNVIGDHSPSHNVVNLSYLCSVVMRAKELCCMRVRLGTYDYFEMNRIEQEFEDDPIRACKEVLGDSFYWGYR